MSIETAIERIAAILGDRVVTSLAERELHGENESYYQKALPDAVAYPESTEEVSQIAKICNEELCPLVPYGAASSLEGQHLAVQGGISLDMIRMSKVLAVNAEDLNVVVQPGITRKTLNNELRNTGLFFPVDPGADASVGGMTATRASGTAAVKYGTMRDNVLAMEVVMADGTIIRTGNQAKKSATGYDLTHLMVGSEGTLGIITELTLKLHGIPEALTAATCRFPSIEDAVNCVIMTIQCGLPVGRIELVDEMMVRGFNNYSKSELPEVPHLFLEFIGTSTGVQEQMQAFGEIAEEFGAEGWTTATLAEDRNKLWAMRHKSHYASAALGEGGHLWPTDVCVPISKLAEAVVQAKEDAVRLGLTSTIVGHVGEGNFHAGVSVDPNNADEMERCEQFITALAETALRLGGTVSGEHGIGLGKLKFMDAEHGASLQYMRMIKKSFDPNNILNPGKMIPAEA